MAEPKKSADAKPTLVRVDSEPKQAPAPVLGRASPAAAPAQKRGGSPLLVWLLVLAASVAALVQTQRVEQAGARIETLSDQVIGLEAQLSAAITQVHTLEMQRGQVREAVAEISESVLLLNELVAE